MISRSSTSRSMDSVSSAAPAEHVLRKQYKDPTKLRKTLDELWGANKYEIRLRNNRYIITGPWQLSQTELDHLEQSAHQHYDDEYY